MKLTAKYQSKLYNDKGQALITMLVPNYRHIALLDELEQDVDYTLEIKKARSKRSIEQNALLWKLLNELEKHSDQDMIDWYIHALEETKCHTTIILAPDGVEKDLMGAYRAVKKIGKRTVINEKTFKETEAYMYRCYNGSSKFTVAEMTELIETVLRYCAELNIDVEVLN